MIVKLKVNVWFTEMLNYTAIYVSYSGVSGTILSCTALHACRSIAKLGTVLITNDISHALQLFVHVSRARRINNIINCILVQLPEST